MAKDSRKKGCPNIDCVNYKNKIFQKADVDYCPKCGTTLVFVCARCFCEIEDSGSEHKICAHCEAKADQNKDKIKDGLKKAGQVAGSAAVALGGAVAAKALPEIKKVVVDKGEKIVVDKGAKIVVKVVKFFIK